LDSSASPRTATKVLVIDDSNTIRRSAEIFLKQGGHEVVLAEDGFDALAKLSDYQPDLVFCDILMPRLDGYQTCAIIKRNPQFASVPVIMLSSKDGLFDKARGRPAFHDPFHRHPTTLTPGSTDALPEANRREPREREIPCPSTRSCWSTIRRPNCTR